MTIFDYTDYKKFFNAWVAALPKGRGEYRRVADALNVSTTMISQVFNGDKHLSMELACDFADYLHFSELETSYLFLLVEYARSGTFRLQQKLKKRIEAAQTEARKLEVRFKGQRTELSEENKAIYYSSWVYGAVRRLTDLDEYNDAGAIATRLNLPRPQIQRVLDYLIREGLVVSKSGKLSVGPTQIILGTSSPLVSNQHQQWRLSGFQKMVFQDEDSFFFTGPMSLSVELADRIRAELPSFVEKIVKEVGPSNSETVRCLNIDWFEF